MSHNQYSAEHRLPLSPPSGEDFFLVTVEIHSDDDPCWNDGFSVLGPWKTINPVVSKFLASDPRAKHSSITVYQGDKARHMLGIHLQNEFRYQQQKRAQSAN